MIRIVARKFLRSLSMLLCKSLMITKNGLPYVGFSFSCPWDSEHGLGVMMHKDRVIDIGDDEMAFDLGRAKKDLKMKK